MTDALVTVVGSFNVDHVWILDALPRPGETRGAAYSSGPGGKGFNQAVAAARSGAGTRFVCALGDDAGATYARALAVADGIDLRDALAAAPTGAAGIFVDAGGRNSIAVAAGANGALDRAHVTHAMNGAPACAVVVAQLETPDDAAVAAFECAGNGALTILNPAPASATPSRALLALARVLTPNETEFASLAALVLGEQVDAASVASLADDVLHRLCRRLLPHGTVAVTLGAGGVYVSHPDEATRGDAQAYYRLPAPAVDVVDTTGAGDAFNGALAASLAQAPATPFRVHVGYAIAYASVSTESPGAALSMPTRDAVATRFTPAAEPAP